MSTMRQIAFTQFRRDIKTMERLVTENVKIINLNRGERPT